MEEVVDVVHAEIEAQEEVLSGPMSATTAIRHHTCTVKHPGMGGTIFQYKCTRVGPQIGHIIKDCPNAGTKTCYKCGGIGHILKECPSRN